MPGFTALPATTLVSPVYDIGEGGLIKALLYAWEKGFNPKKRITNNRSRLLFILNVLNDTKPQNGRIIFQGIEGLMQCVISKLVGLISETCDFHTVGFS